MPSFSIPKASRIYSLPPPVWAKPSQTPAAGNAAKFSELRSGSLWPSLHLSPQRWGNSSEADVLSLTFLTPNPLLLALSVTTPWTDNKHCCFHDPREVGKCQIKAHLPIPLNGPQISGSSRFTYVYQALSIPLAPLHKPCHLQGSAQILHRSPISCQYPTYFPPYLVLFLKSVITLNFVCPRLSLLRAEAMCSLSAVSSAEQNSVWN